jgi:hypothetical protein
VTALNLLSDIFRDFRRPAFRGVETDGADRVVMLAGDQVLDCGLKIVESNLSFPVAAADLTEIVLDNVPSHPGRLALWMVSTLNA